MEEEMNPEIMPEKLCVRSHHKCDGGWVCYDESKVVGSLIAASVAEFMTTFEIKKQ